MTVLITVHGIVQGIGYRPFVARLAQEMGICGSVMNIGGIVTIVANGEKETIDIFVYRLKFHQPKGADVTEILTKIIPERHYDSFFIIPSEQFNDTTPLIPADLPLCDDCKRELYDQDNRRYLYPFISCVACGPRYSIINSIPYDRETITMDDFFMCEECEKEYKEAYNRRRHAQTISCHDCGPQLILQLNDSVLYKDQALKKSIELLKLGKVIAIKGIGGYQFVCLPTDKNAVDNLRLLKHRDKKPFAVMFPNLDLIKECCKVNTEEEKLLTSAAFSIVLLHKKKDIFYEGVSGESRFIGAFLPYTPLHQLLIDACGALVMTSGNITSEPIIINDEEILSLRTPYLAGVLYNKRRIVTSLDDSVARIIRGKIQLVRRSRGYVPLPVLLKDESKQAILAMGSDLKSSFCLYKNNRAYLSQYFGDMENYYVSKAYKDNLIRMTQIFKIKPEIFCCDLHPGYLTTRFAEELAKKQQIKLVKIQHHHAHIASVMAEHEITSCIGVAFDGTGFGTDGAVWGGEFLLCNNNNFQRCGHLKYITICGGDEAARNARLTADCYLNAVGRKFDNDNFKLVQNAIKNNINTFKCSSMGRLFDAVSAVLQIKTENSYEGECAIALENTAVAYKENDGIPFNLNFNIKIQQEKIIIDQVKLLNDIYLAYTDGVYKGALALGFHMAVAKMVLQGCEFIRKQSGENKVALSGGVFANLLLIDDCIEIMEKAGFSVYINSVVPTNDGGISLGQAWLCKQL